MPVPMPRNMNWRSYIYLLNVADAYNCAPE